MDIDIFYKVRGEKVNGEREGEIRITEKGILRFLRTGKSRQNLRRAVEEQLRNSSDTFIYGAYVWDPIDKRQIAFTQEIL